MDELMIGVPRDLSCGRFERVWIWTGAKTELNHQIQMKEEDEP